MNNIPLVAMMIPEVTSWARKRGSDAAKFLLPLSYAFGLLGQLLPGLVAGTRTRAHRTQPALHAGRLTGA